MITRATNRDSTRETAMLFPGGFDHYLIRCGEAIAQTLERRSRHVDPTDVPENAILPDHHLAKGSMDIHSNDAPHIGLPVSVDDGSGGRHDTYGFALTAQPGESQRRPANNTSS